MIAAAASLGASLHAGPARGGREEPDTPRRSVTKPFWITLVKVVAGLRDPRC